MRFALPAIAAALALIFTAPVVAEHVSAQPARPHFDPGDRGDRGDRRRAEIEQLRAELGHYQQAYAELSAGVDRAERANRRNRDRRSMTQIDRALREARDRAAQHVQPWASEQQQPDWRDKRDWRTQPQTLPAASRAMNDRDFRALTDQVGRASFADDKLAVVQTAAQTNYFTVAQVVALMKLASFDDTRVEIAAACAPHVVDGDKWFEVYGALSFSSSRDTLRDRVGGR
jgi:hypothetical protein